jgi:hypothetical protein
MRKYRKKITIILKEKKMGQSFYKILKFLGTKLKIRTNFKDQVGSFYKFFNDLLLLIYENLEIKLKKLYKKSRTKSDIYSY